MGKSSNSGGAAEGAQISGEFARETARDVTYADRPDQVNPLGQIRWGTKQVIDPATGEEVTKWEQSQILDPRLQGQLDTEMGILGQRGNMSVRAMNRANEEQSEAPDFDQFGEPIAFDPTERRQYAEDQAYGKATNRLDPRIAQEAQNMEIKLRNQGLTPGDQGWNAAMSNFGNYKSDAYEQARLGSTAEGRSEYDTLLKGNERANELRNLKISEYVDKRGFSLGESDRLREGQSLPDIAKIIGGA